MNIIQRSRRFVEMLRSQARRSSREARVCVYCGSTYTIKYGCYYRHPWTLNGRQTVHVQRHRCSACGRTYKEEHAELVARSWYERAVHRCAVDWWVHGRSSLRRTADMLRSMMGHQERWWQWHVWREPMAGALLCRFGASTLHRWLVVAGQHAQEHIAGQLAGIETSGQMGTDGLWVRLRAKAKAVVLGLVDSATGVLWGVVVTSEEESEQGWRALFAQAQQAGLVLEHVNGLVSDGVQGLLGYLRKALGWVHAQRCVWHYWRNLAADLARAVAKGVDGLAVQAAQSAAQTLRQELTALLHAVIDASDGEAAEQALQRLREHPLGGALARKVNEQLDRLLYHRLACHRGLARIGPEWLWRDFRLRLSHGRNHGRTERLQQAGLVWMVYHNMTPAQWRSERKRRYKHPGQSPLEAAGSSPGELTYLDALAV
jgi:transposase-like protein